jgi:hypothetical protein
MSRPQAVPDGFAAFWKAYPRRVAKGAAFKAWVAQDCEPIADDIIKAVKKSAWSDDSKFIPHAATWLNAWRWMDEEEGNSADTALQDALRGT